mgnify:CR=1 FL=1
MRAPRETLSLVGHTEAERLAVGAHTWGERAERMLERMRAHQSAMADHVAQLKAFYGQLSPEQQKIFDDAHRGERRGMRGRGMGPAAK